MDYQWERMKESESPPFGGPQTREGEEEEGGRRRGEEKAVVSCASQNCSRFLILSLTKPTVTTAL